MANNNAKINLLSEKLEMLLKRQESFLHEIIALRKELIQLKNDDQKEALNEAVYLNKPVVSPRSDAPKNDAKVSVYETPHYRQKDNNPAQPQNHFNGNTAEASNLEKFIGENLMNKIGIAITVIGVAIGAKYSIENELISPLTRIIMGYLVGLGLLGLGIKLKAKYTSFSAVLVSGAMAILYFITFFAFDLYGFIPRMFAFLLMLIFTIFTVVAALHYNRQIIAHIALVGGYAVPFLLSDGSGKVAVLFSYIAILNMGMLYLAFKKYWKPLNYVSFVFTWLIFLTWYALQYKTTQHFQLAWVFLFLFFSIFYISFLAYKLIQKEKFVTGDVVLILINSFIFYGVGYFILGEHSIGKHYLGAFTLLNAFIHFAVSYVIFRQKLVDKNILNLISGLVLVFLTITIPVQMDGSWVTLLWVGQAALLFWIGRTKNIGFYELMSYALMVLALMSLVQDWGDVYYSYPEKEAFVPLLNINFLTSILFTGSFLFISLLNKNKSFSVRHNMEGLSKVMWYAIPATLIFTLFMSFKLEIDHYWQQRFAKSTVTFQAENREFPDHYWNYDILKFQTIWVLIYTLSFVSALSFVNMKYIKSHLLGAINLGGNVLALLIFLALGLLTLSELRESYMDETLTQFYHKGSIYLWLRYLTFGFVALILYFCYRYYKQMFASRFFKKAFELVLHITILWIASSELLHWSDIYNSEQSYKLVLSILWGVYSLFLIAFGIWKQNQPIRFGAITLFGITLFKLFFYDIAHLNTLSKTVVFLSLGSLLLIISFLYNKYKLKISPDEVES